DLLRLAQPDLLPKRIGAKAAATSDNTVDRAFALVVLDHDLDPGADGHAIGLDAPQLELDPMIAVAGIGEELIAIVVPGVGAAHDRVDVLIPIVVDVAERDRVALL